MKASEWVVPARSKTTTGPEGRQLVDADATLKGPLFHAGFGIRIYHARRYTPYPSLRLKNGSGRDDAGSSKRATQSA
jgi:hypothetical protein